jgi:hypothetical protein
MFLLSHLSPCHRGCGSVQGEGRVVSTPHLAELWRRYCQCQKITTCGWIEVWAVQYTTVTGERSVAIMESRDVAMDWMQNLVRTSWAKPVLRICIPNSQFTRVRKPLQVTIRTSLWLVRMVTCPELHIPWSGVPPARLSGDLLRLAHLLLSCAFGFGTALTTKPSAPPQAATNPHRK